MPVAEVSGGGTGVAFMVGAGLVAELVAKACSSPQTAELNAHVRAPTLMKWVNVGLVEALAFVTIAAVIDRRQRAAIIAGGLLEGIITYMQYQHAKAAGLASNQPGTEDY